MNIKESVEKILAEWPLMIADLKVSHANLSKSPNKAPADIKSKQRALIESGKKLALEMNLKTSNGILSLEMFVEWCFDKMSPDYRVAKWYGMLEYIKKKHGKYILPQRSSDDPREVQYYNMISLLRNTYRGKKASINLDKKVLLLPCAKKWICCSGHIINESYSNHDWHKILNFTKKKYGFYNKPAKSSEDPKEEEIYKLLKNIQRSYKKGILKKSILKLPKAQQWLAGVPPSDLDKWNDYLDYSKSKYGKYSKPDIKSKDLLERSFATKINLWRSALLNNTAKQPDPKIFSLPMAGEWLSITPKLNPLEMIKIKWLNYIDYMYEKYDHYKFPQSNSTDPFEKKFHLYIRYLFKRIQVNLTPAQREALFLLPMAREWLNKSAKESRLYYKWNEMLGFLKRKYGQYQKPAPLPNDDIERKFYFFTNNMRKKVIKSGQIPKVLADLPMSKEWLLD